MADFTQTLQVFDELKIKPDDFKFEGIAVKPLYLMFQKYKAGQTLTDIYDRGIIGLYQKRRP